MSTREKPLNYERTPKRKCSGKKENPAGKPWLEVISTVGKDLFAAVSGAGEPGELRRENALEKFEGRGTDVQKCRHVQEHTGLYAP